MFHQYPISPLRLVARILDYYVEVLFSTHPPINPDDIHWFVFLEVKNNLSPAQQLSQLTTL